MVDRSISPPQPINSGVPRECVLSPNLFLIFINVFLSITTNPMHLFANDFNLVLTLYLLNNYLQRVATWRIEATMSMTI